MQGRSWGAGEGSGGEEGVLRHGEGGGEEGPEARGGSELASRISMSQASVSLPGPGHWPVVVTGASRQGGPCGRTGAEEHLGRGQVGGVGSWGESQGAPTTQHPVLLREAEERTSSLGFGIWRSGLAPGPGLASWPGA